MTRPRIEPTTSWIPAGQRVWLCSVPGEDYCYCSCTYRFCIWAATWQSQQSDSTPSENSVQPGHPPSLIRVFAVHMKTAWVLSYPLSAQRRLWSDWVDAQADLSLRWAHTQFVGFVMSRLICYVEIFCWIQQSKWHIHRSIMSTLVNSQSIDQLFIGI